MIYSKVEELVGSETINDIKYNITKILDEKIKTRCYINKHFQNAITNYFLEDYGSLYLKEEFSKPSNREVRRYLTSLAEQRGYKGTKYMIMMNIYFDVHEQLGLVKEYRQLLTNVALQLNPFPEDSQEFISQSWKKSFGLFVLAHSFDRSINSIFEIWNVLFVDDQINRKRKPNLKDFLLPLEVNNKDIPLVKQQSQTVNSQVLESTDIDSNINTTQPTSFPLKTEVALVPNKNSSLTICIKTPQIKQEASSSQCDQPCDQNSNASSTTLNYNIACKKEHLTKIEYQSQEQKIQQLEEQQQHQDSQILLEQQFQKQQQQQQQQEQQLLQQQEQHQLYLQHQQQQPQHHQQHFFMQIQRPQGYAYQYPETILANHPNMHYNYCFNNISGTGYFLAPSPPQMIIYPTTQYSAFQQQQNQMQYLGYLEQQHHYQQPQYQMRSFPMMASSYNQNNMA